METTEKKFIDGANLRYNRKWYPTVTKDFDELVTSYDYSRIVSASRRLYANHGVVKGVIQQKATYSIGQAFLARSRSANVEWRKTATEWANQWLQICNNSGLDFQTTLYLISVSVDRDGDAFVLLTETNNNYPQIQCIPSHQVGQRSDEKTVTSGRYKGNKITKGVIRNKFGRPIAYRVLGATEQEDRDISADNMIHVYDPEYFEQSRGLGLFSHSVNQFRDMADSTEKELLSQLLLSSIAFVEHNPVGAADDTNAVGAISYSADGRPTCETFEDGTIKFFKSGDGSKLEAVNNNRPSAEYQAFHDRLERIALVGTGWPKVLLDAAQGNGVADRVALRQGQRACEDRQSLLMPVALRIVNYGISKAIKNGLLPFDEDFYKWSFSKPPFLSIDFGRDSNAVREEYKLGIRNLSEILEEQGKNLEDHLYQRAMEEAQATLIRQQVESEYGVQIDPLKMRLTSANEFTPTAQ